MTSSSVDIKGEPKRFSNGALKSCQKDHIYEQYTVDYLQIVVSYWLLITWKF